MRSRAAAALAGHADRLSRLVRAARAGDPEAVHDLRVTARRVETWLRLWDDAGDTEALRLRVRRVRRGAGAAREDEVLVGMLRDGRLGGEWVPRAMRLRWLARLEAAPGRVRRLPSPRTVDAVAESLRDTARRLRAGRGGGARVSRRTDRWARRARKRVAKALGSGDMAALHDARLAVKRWRYAVEAVGGAVARQAPEARRWQRVLGDANDRAALVAFARRQGREGRALARRLEQARVAAIRSWRRRLGDPAAPSSAR
ncbi:MAG: CHAD domain-containing protein [bacterium]